MWIFIVGVTVYMTLMIGVGLLSLKKVKNSDDYFVAGRNLSLPVIVGTLTAGFLGTGTVVGYGALTYNTGFGGFWWIGGGLLGLLFIVIIAKKLNKLSIYTLPDILELRFGPSTKLLATIPIVIAYTSIVGSQMKAIGYILELLTGINPTVGLLIAAVVVIAYTVMGGMISVAYTDVFQYVILFVGLLIAAPIAFSAAGGLSGWTMSLPETHFQFTGEMGIIAGLGVALPYFMLTAVDQNLFQRMFSARNGNVAQKGMILTMIGTFVVMVLILVIGMSSSVLFPNINPDLAVYNVALELLNPFFGMILLLAILSLIMSSADSYLLSPATNIVKNIYERFMNPTCSDEKALKLTRLWIVILGVLGLLGATLFQTFLEYALASYTFYGAAMFFPVIAALFWKRATMIAVNSSIIGGTVSSIIWEFFIDSSIPTIFIGSGLSLILLVVVSLFTSHATTEKKSVFEERENSDDDSLVKVSS